jgi:hypothetical protein
VESCCFCLVVLTPFQAVCSGMSRGRLLLCLDKFKGTISSLEAARALASGVGRQFEHVTTVSMADGFDTCVDCCELVFILFLTRGDGFVEAMRSLLGLRAERVVVNSSIPNEQVLGTAEVVLQSEWEVYSFFFLFC